MMFLLVGCETKETEKKMSNNYEIHMETRKMIDSSLEPEIRDVYTTPDCIALEAADLLEWFSEPGDDDLNLTILLDGEVIASMGGIEHPVDIYKLAKEMNKEMGMLE